MEVGHDFPANLDPATADVIGSCARAALYELGLGIGPAHSELRLTSNGPKIVEVNPRLAGGMIPSLVQLATGIDLVTATVARAAGQAVSLGDQLSHAAVIRFLLPDKEGILGAPLGLAKARTVPGVVEIVVTASPKTEYRRNHSFRDRVGYIISFGESCSAARTSADMALGHLSIPVLSPILSPVKVS